MKHRLIAGSALLIALSAVVWVQPARAGTTFTVTSTVDSVDAQPGNGVCATAWSVCTLRSAIMEANALPGDDTIALPAGTYLLTLEGALDITDNLTLTGAGAATTIMQAKTPNTLSIDSVLAIGYGTTASIANITVRDKSSWGGSGISNRGQLTLSNSVVTNNSAGGGIFNGWIATVTNSTVSDNTASGAGGGIFNTGTLTLTNSTVSGNSAVSGGGISNDGTLVLTSSTISGNTTDRSGGGIANRGTLTVTNSTVSGNTTHGAGGGIFNARTLTIHNGTIANNASTGYVSGEGPVGAGILNANLPNSTVTVKNTILANNTSAVGPTGDCSGTFTSQGYNLIENIPSKDVPSKNCTITGDTSGNITGKDPLLAPLQHNGGPTWTHALQRIKLPGFGTMSSLAFNAGDPAECKDAQGKPLSTDQRSVTRPQGPRCDIGAYEVGVIVPIGPPPTVGPVPTIGPNPTIAPGLTPAPTLQPPGMVPTLEPVLVPTPPSVQSHAAQSEPSAMPSPTPLP